MADLISRGLDYADMTGTEFPDENRLLDYANDGLAELHDLMANAGGSDYFRQDEDYSVTSGTESYSLPGNFMRALQVFYTSGGRRYRVERWNPAEIDGLRSSPLSSGSVTLWYVPQYTRRTLPAEQVPPVIPVGWEDYAALHIAIRLLMREQSDPSLLMNERERLKQRIIAMLEPRDSGEPDSIGDVGGRWDHSLTLEQRSFKYRIMGQNIYFVDADYLGA